MSDQDITDLDEKKEKELLTREVIAERISKAIDISENTEQGEFGIVPAKRFKKVVGKRLEWSLKHTGAFRLKNYKPGEDFECCMSRSEVGRIAKDVEDIYMCYRAKEEQNKLKRVLTKEEWKWLRKRLSGRSGKAKKGDKPDGDSHQESFGDDLLSQEPAISEPVVSEPSTSKPIVSEPDVEQVDVETISDLENQKPSGDNQSLADLIEGKVESAVGDVILRKVDEIIKQSLEKALNKMTAK